MNNLTNLELKARCGDLNEAHRRVRAIGAVDQGSSHDIDTYFRVPSGRFKLRELDGGPRGVLIYYDRPDEAHSRYSDYYLAHIADCASLKNLLTAAFDILVVVEKDRHLYMYGDTRIHLDTVEGLGTFVELETVIRGQREVDAVAEHEYVKEALALDHGETLAVSYSDLVLARSGRDDAGGRPGGLSRHGV